jgi:predicted Rossmann fold nucleotide-binding protein DprA/Smf involved in DNA uptake
MEIRDYLSDDGQTILALCSALALPKDSPDAPAPFKLSEWNELERQIEKSALKNPCGLQGHSADELEKTVGISADDAERIVQLLGRSAPLSLELENLFSRGIWAVTRLDEKYPAKLRDTLKDKAPTVFFGAGEIGLVQRGGIAVIGSRNIDEAGAAFAKEIGRKAVRARLPVISGGARGTDRIAMDGALEAEGQSIGVMADSLESTVRKSDVRELLLDGRLVLCTPYLPTAGFSVGGAMGRNKIIYGLADYAVVVSSDHQTGGTWAGAVEALKADWCPVFVRDGENVPKGNRELVKLGAVSLQESALDSIENLADWMRQRPRTGVTQPDLFGSKEV